jgi:RNA polymerase sigma factor (sigma-70 family)
MKKTKREKNPLQETGEPQEYSTKNIPVSSHYVDNKKFLEALIEYRKKVVAAESKGEELPQVPNYIGECFIKIATHLSYKSNFINYTFRDDMISDGIENCLTAAAKFDPEKSSNPFAYYTQIIYFACIRRIQKEKKQQATKYKIIENLDLDAIMQESDNSEVGQQLVEYLKKQLDTVDPDKRLTPTQLKSKKAKLSEKVQDITEL